MIVLVNSNQTSDIDAHDIVSNLSRFVYLPMLTTIELGPAFDASRWKEIQFILQYVESIVDTPN